MFSRFPAFFVLISKLSHNVLYGIYLVIDLICHTWLV